MNWKTDIKDLTKRQWAGVATGGGVFCGLLYLLAASGYVVTMALITLVVVGGARYYLHDRER